MFFDFQSSFGRATTRIRFGTKSALVAIVALLILGIAFVARWVFPLILR